ncbi:MAG: PaaI family thioesterase [Deltaproteobacteria bacterium]|nr:PaaI family thioesterase [Deltaproteobacteria bacterium]
MSRADVPATSGYGNCFGCSPRNVNGLKLKFEIAPGRVSAWVELGPEFESFPGMIHGGIIATLLDEVMAQAALREGRCPATTAGMRVRYAQVMETNRIYRVIAESGGRTGDVVTVQGRLETPEGALVAVSDGTFLLWTQARAESAKLTLPPPAMQSLKQFFRDLEVSP